MLWHRADFRMCHMNDDGGLTSNEYIYIFHGANRIELCIWKPQQLQGFTSHWFKLNYGLVPGFSYVTNQDCSYKSQTKFPLSADSSETTFCYLILNILQSAQQRWTKRRHFDFWVKETLMFMATTGKKHLSLVYSRLCIYSWADCITKKRFKCNLIHDKISFTFGSFYLIVLYNPVLYSFPDTVSISCNILCILPVQLSLYGSKGDLDVFWLGSLFTISRERAFVCMALGRALVVKYWTTDLMHYFCTHIHIQKAKVPGAHAGTQNMTIIKYDIHKYFCQ